MQEYMDNQNQLMKAASAMMWQPSSEYEEGDIVISPAMPANTEAVCMVAGMTDTVLEPSWTMGSNIPDGSCFWKLRYVHYTSFLASEEEAAAGTDTEKIMTPATVKVAVGSMNAASATKLSETNPISNGGTGATTAQEARANLEVLKRIAERNNNADLNSFTEAGIYYVSKDNATESQGWTSDIWGTNGFLEVFVATHGTYTFVKQVYRRGGTSDSNDWQVCTRQSMDGGITWGKWRRIDNGGEQRTLANTGYYQTTDGLVLAWTNIGKTDKNPCTVNKPIPFRTLIAQATDCSTVGDATRAHQWVSDETTDTTDTFKRSDINDASTVFWVGRVV